MSMPESAAFAPQEQTVDVPIVAIDDGYAQTKLYTRINGVPKRQVLRSAARPGKIGLGNIDGEPMRGVYTTPEGESYVVDESIDTEDTRFEGFHVSPLNRVLVQHALITAGFGGRDVRLITGLPVSDYFRGGQTDKEHIARKRENLKKSLDAGPDAPARLLSVNVRVQAVSAFFDWVIGDDLQQRHSFDQTVAVVDLGGRTTDVALLIDGQRIDHTRSGSVNLGVLDVYSALSSTLNSQFDLRDPMPVKKLDKAVREKTIRLGGQDYDLEETISAIVLEQEHRIAREISRKIGAGAALDAIIFVGGGAALFSSIATHFKNGEILSDPEFSNARGMWKYEALRSQDA